MSNEYYPAGSRLVDVDLIRQMFGLNAETAKVINSANNKINLKNQLKINLRVSDQQSALNTFKYTGLPKSIGEKLLEKILYYRFQGAFFYMATEDKYYFLPFAPTTMPDVYGRYLSLTPIQFNGSMTQDKEKEKPWIQGLEKNVIYDTEDLPEGAKEDGCVILQDYTSQISQSAQPRAALSEAFIDFEAECIPFARTALLNSTGITGMKVVDQSAASQVYAASGAINNAALTGQKFIPIVGEMGMETLTGGQAGRAQDFLEIMQATDNMRLACHGLEQGGLFLKKERLITDEAENSQSNASSALIDRLENRQLFCERINKVFGLNVSVDIRAKEKNSYSVGLKEEKKEEGVEEEVEVKEKEEVEQNG